MSDARSASTPARAASETPVVVAAPMAPGPSSAFLQVRAGEKQNAVACAGELASRLFRASRYEAYPPPAEETLPVRLPSSCAWMLSDGAGAVAVATPLRAACRCAWSGSSCSYAHEHATCMYAGAPRERPDGSMGPGWLDYPSFDAAGHEGALFLRQDVRQLDALVRLGVDGFFRLVDEGRLTPPGDRSRRRLPATRRSVLPDAAPGAAREGRGAPAARKVVLEPGDAGQRRLGVGVRAARGAGQFGGRAAWSADLRHGARERPLRRQLREAHGRSDGGRRLRARRRRP